MPHLWQKSLRWGVVFFVRFLLRLQVADRAEAGRSGNAFYALSSSCQLFQYFTAVPIYAN